MEKRGSEYDSHKEKLSKNILKVVMKHVPEIKGSIDFHELSTPLTVKSLANYSKGEMYGLDHSPKRFRQRWLRPSSGMKNLFLQDRMLQL